MITWYMIAGFGLNIELKILSGVSDEEGDDFGLMEPGDDSDDADDSAGEELDVESNVDTEDEMNRIVKDDKRNVKYSESSGLGSKSKAIDDVNDSKKEKWGELADKIKEIADKKQKEKEKKKQKTVTFDNKINESEDEDTQSSDSDEEEEFEDEVESEGDDSGGDDDDFGDAIEDKDNDIEDEGDFENSDFDEVESEIVQDKEEFTEDIYGRLRDKDGNIVQDNKPAGGGGAYVPPAKRLQMAGTVDEKRKIQMERLQKQLKGLINRYGCKDAFV